MNSVNRLLLLALVGLVAVPAPGLAQGGAKDLSQVSIEDLMNIEITSASRKEQRVVDVAAAVFVITSDDIRRSGMTTIPELLRLVPGVDVAQINSNKWAVSVRGFNALYANKLLVLVDGRSLYNRVFSGVLWDAEDLMVDDVDRIEVIRGPGAAVWGANAVNGVINIISKATTDSLGGLARLDSGRLGDQAAFRYGGTLGAASYRLYAQWTGRDQSLLAAGVPAGDASHSLTTGFRTDWRARTGAFTLEGAFTTSEARALWPNFDPQSAAREPVAKEPSDAREGHLLGRWIRTGTSGASLRVQSSVDIATRRETLATYDRQTAEVDAQYRTPLGARHDLVTGAAYRFINEELLGKVGLTMTPPANSSSLLTGFIQDEIALFDTRLAITLGSQVQWDSEFGAGVQPTARAMWKGLPRQRIWVAASRALRTPSLTDLGFRLDYPPAPTDSGLPLYVTALGNTAVKTASLVDAEVGYRLEIGTAISLDVTGYAGRYDQLPTRETAAPVVEFVPSPRILVISQLGNRLSATTRGLEIAGHWMPSRAWRLDAGYTAFHITPHVAADSLDLLAPTEDGSAPRSQWQARSAYSAGPHATFNAAIFHVGRLERFQVAAYTRTDIGLEWRFNGRLSAMATGQNVFTAAHAEFASAGSLALATQTPRSAGLRLRWTF